MEKNELEKFQFEKPDDYINALRYNIDLNKLYTVVDSCCYNQESEFCSVLVKVEFKLEEIKKFSHDYLLQVWSNEGKMIFERKLLKPLAAWNIIGQNLVFQEQSEGITSPTIFLLEMSKTQQCKIFKFEFSNQIERIQEENQNDQDENDAQQSAKKIKVIPRTLGIAKQYLIFSINNRIYYTNIEDIKKQYTPRSFKSKLEIQYFQLENGCKLMSILDFGEETVLCIKNQLNQLNFFQVQGFSVQGFSVQGFSEKQDQVSLELLKLNMEENNDPRLKIYQEGKQSNKKRAIQPNQISQALEDVTQIRFVVMLDEKKVYQHSNNDLKENNDGQSTARSNKTIKNDSDIKKKFTCSALVIREDLSFEFYSDWNLVSYSNHNDLKKNTKSTKKDFKITDIEIETDNNNFYLKTIKEKDGIETTDLFEISLFWGNLIGMSVAKNILSNTEIKDVKKQKNSETIENQKDKKKLLNEKFSQKIESSRHKRISGYFRLFTQFLNFHTYMIVAHREFISIFDFRDTNGYIKKTIEHDDEVKLIQTVNYKEDVKEDEKQQLEQLGVLVLLGNNKIHRVNFNYNEEVPAYQIPNKIICYSIDQNDHSAFYYITQQNEKSKQEKSTFYEIDGDRLRYHEEQIISQKRFQLFACRDFKQVHLYDFVDINLDIDVNMKVYQRRYDDNDEQKNVTNLFISNKFNSFSLSVNFENQEQNDQISNTPKVDLSSITYHHEFIEKSKDNFEKEETEKKDINWIKEIDEHFENNQFINQGTLVGVVHFKGEKDSEKRNDYIARITSKTIQVFDSKGKLVECYTNTCIQNIVLIDSNYLYCLCESSNQPIKKYDFRKQQAYVPKGASISKQINGLYVYDMNSFLQDGVIENYYLAPAVVGLASQLDFSDSNGRISYYTNFNQLSMLPFPHRNTINFLGMDDSNDYLIWREKDGFLSALNKDGALRIWSIGSGKFIGSYKVEKIKGNNNLNNFLTVDKLKKNYEIYKASSGTQIHGDTCYTKGFQNYKDYSIQLFIDKNNSIQEENKTVMEERSKIFQNQRGQNVNILRKEDKEYNFVVLKLETIYDKENKFEVGVLRTFTHRLHVKNNDRFPSLYLTKDALKMMEVIDRQIAIIYEPESNKNKDYYNYCPVKWVVKYFINQYPTILQGIQPMPFLFDPEFKKYIDVDYTKGLFVIKQSDPAKQHKNIEIPKSLLDLSIVREFEHQDQVEDKNLDPKKIKLQNEESIAEIAKRIHFFRSDKLRIINLEGIDTIFDIKTQQIVAYSKRDNQNVFKSFEKINNLKDRHLILDNFVFEQKDILERLVNRCQNYKSDIEFAKFDLAMQNIYQEQVGTYQKPKILNFLFKVDYQSNNFLAEVSFTLLDWITTERILQDPVFDLENIDRLQQIQLCFNIFPKSQTILHKLALDAVQSSQDDETTESIDAVTQKLFCACKKGLRQSEYFKLKQPFEIPLLEDMNGDTVLDIALNDDDKTNLIQKIKQVVNIIYPMSEDSIFKNTEQKIFKEQSFWIINYLQKKLPTVVIRYLRGVMSRLIKYKNEKQELLLNLHLNKTNMLNSQMAMTVLAYMQNYSYLHSSSSIYRSVIRSINIALPNIGEYLDSRCVASEHMPNRTQHELKKIPFDWSFVYRQEYWCTEDKYTNETNTDSKKWVNQVYNTVSAKIWDKKQFLQDNLFKSSGVQKNMIIRYFDVPQMQLNSKVGFKFLSALKEAARQNEEIALDFYSKRIVQILINEHWERTYGWLLGLMFIPYVAMLIVFEIWSNFTLQTVGGWSDEAGSSLQTILIIFSSYFLAFDFVQLLLMTSMKSVDIWFLIKVIPMCLVLYCTTYYDVTQVTIPSEDPKIQENSLRFWQIQAFAGFFMWFRMLYYLRSLEHFSYFIRMLIEVIRKITIFLIILAIVVLGFADTFYSLSTGQLFAAPISIDKETNEPVFNQYITSYTNSLQYSYEIVLGQFDPELNNRDPLTWVFFVLASVISMLILSNMLIEIVSQTYGDISDVKYLYVFKERVELICDWESTLQVLKYFRDFCILPFNILKWALKITRCGGKKIWKAAERFAFKKYVNHYCNLVVVAWEDPEDKDTTPDFIEDENIETTDEKIDVLQQSLNDIKQQLGLEAEIQESYEDVSNPIKSISEIDEKLEKVINALGVQNFKNQKPQAMIPIPRVQHEARMTQKVVQYKKDEVFKWQQKMQILI